MSNLNGEDEQAPKHAVKRKSEMSETEMLQALRKVSQEAHAERRKYLVITVCVVVGVFAFRQFIPPVWMIWL